MPTEAFIADYYNFKYGYNFYCNRNLDDYGLYVNNHVILD